jgi:two-component system LytT family response regulator
MISCIIIDDEEYSIETLSEYIKRTDFLELIGTYTNSSEAITSIQSGRAPDLVFLDIDMPELNGFEVAALLPAGTAIIYITAFSNYALKAFETNVYDFLLKPISIAKFLKSANKVRDIMISYRQVPLKPMPDFIFVNPGIKGKVIKIAFDKILYIEGLKNYIIIHTDSGKQITYLTMQEIEVTLNPDMFLRIHKSFIVNRAKITVVEGNTISLINNISLPLGGIYKSSVTNFINNHTVVSKRKH